MKYKTIRNALATMFSIQSGLTDEEGAAALHDSMQNDVWRESLKSELVQAFQDPGVCWHDMLVNDDYEVYEPESDEQGKEWVRSLLWNAAFSFRTQ
jgi:hypothetical protein